MMDRFVNDRLIRILTVIGKSVRKCLAIRVRLRLNRDDVLDVLSGLFVLERLLDYIRSDNGNESTVNALKNWLRALGSTREDGYNEGFNDRLREELLQCESFDTLQEAQVLLRTGATITIVFRAHNVSGQSSTPLFCLIPLRSMRRDRR